MFLFFFKQKTAYEMRISDWSSDVCSSDLAASTVTPTTPAPSASTARASPSTAWPPCIPARTSRGRAGPTRAAASGAWPATCGTRSSSGRHGGDRDRRSEEHTSELQSLMRISYAVFCLKKKKHKRTQDNVHKHSTKTNE